MKAKGITLYFNLKSPARFQRKTIIFDGKLVIYTVFFNKNNFYKNIETFII